MNIIIETLTIIKTIVTYENILSIFLIPINILISILLKLKSNLTFLFIFIPIVYALYNIFKNIKLKYDELNLFNVYLMSDEERKLYVFTQKLTSINQKFYDNSIESRVNKGKYSIYTIYNVYNVHIDFLL